MIEIKSTKQNKENNLNFVIFGDSGVGKTSLAKTLPMNEVLILDLENGLLSLANDDYDFKYVDVKSIKDIRNILKDERFKQFKYFMIDSGTELSQNHYALLKKKFNGIEDVKKTDQTMNLFREFLEDFSVLFKEFRDLKKTVILNCLAREADYKKSGISKTAPDIIGKSGERIMAWFDEVFFMHIDKDGSRKFLTETTTKTHAKDRSTKLDKIEDADLGKVIKKILGKNK